MAFKFGNCNCNFYKSIVLKEWPKYLGIVVKRRHSKYTLKRFLDIIVKAVVRQKKRSLQTVGILRTKNWTVRRTNKNEWQWSSF